MRIIIIILLHCWRSLIKRNPTKNLISLCFFFCVRKKYYSYTFYSEWLRDLVTVRCALNMSKLLCIVFVVDWNVSIPILYQKNTNNIFCVFWILKCRTIPHSRQIIFQRTNLFARNTIENWCDKWVRKR